MEREERFMVDHMVRKLGKYLRIIGYDAIWLDDVRTHELIKIANKENRIFVTRNKHIYYEYPRPSMFLVVASDDPVYQLKEVMEKFNLNTDRLFSRCIKCNVDLGCVEDKINIKDRVYPGVFLRYNRFYYCPLCSTVFWRGSHVYNTCKKLGIELPAE